MSSTTKTRTASDYAASGSVNGSVSECACRYVIRIYIGCSHQYYGGRTSMNSTKGKLEAGAWRC